MVAQPTRMRPKFTVELPLSADELMQCIESILDDGNLRCRGTSARRCAELFVDESERRFWSPHLSIQVHEATNGSVLSCRYSPRPELWTFFMFVYFLMAFVVLFGSAFGYVQWLLGSTPWGLLAVPAGILVIVLLHGASLVGQRLSSDQMDLLRERLDTILECTSLATAATKGTSDDR